MKNYILLIAMLLMPFTHQAMVYEGMPHKQLTFFEKVAYGICPAGMEKVGAVLVSGAVALPGIALESYLNATYSDIPIAVSNGLLATSVATGLYAAYKTYNKLQQSTEQSLRREKEILLNKLKTIIPSDQDNTSEMIAERVQLIFHRHNNATWLVESYLYVKDLLDTLETLNQKLTALDKPLFKTVPEFMHYWSKLDRTLLHIQLSPLFKIQERDYIQNKWSTITGQYAWWATKHSIKGAAKVTWYATKTVVKTSLKLSWLMLKNAINSIPLP